MKYDSYEDLFAAFRAGELEGWVLWMDNDNCSLSWNGSSPEGLTEEQQDEWASRKYEEGQRLFHGNGQLDAVEMLRGAGIPCESC